MYSLGFPHDEFVWCLTKVLKVVFDTSSVVFSLPPTPPAAVVNVKSSKTQTGGATGRQAGVGVLPAEGGAPRQYYFSPTMGYVPLTSSASGELDCSLWGQTDRSLNPDKKGLGSLGS